jgi:hypothetical protein
VNCLRRLQPLPPQSHSSQSFSCFLLRSPTVTLGSMPARAPGVPASHFACPAATLQASASARAGRAGQERTSLPGDAPGCAAWSRAHLAPGAKLGCAARTQELAHPGAERASCRSRTGRRPCCAARTQELAQPVSSPTQELAPPGAAHPGTPAERSR